MDISFFPENAIPRMGTQPRQYIDLILQGPVEELDAMLMCKGNQRSPIQALRGDEHDHWMIHSILDKKGRIVSRELDWRHLSGDNTLDAQARLERKKELEALSFKEAIQGLNMTSNIYHNKLQFAGEIKLLSAGQTAEILGLKESTLAQFRWRGDKRLPWVKIGKSIRYKLADIEAFIERSTVRQGA